VDDQDSKKHQGAKEKEINKATSLNNPSLGEGIETARHIPLARATWQKRGGD
jgi:hypothetical protein